MNGAGPIAIVLRGGLGNQLFQIAAGFLFRRLTSRQVVFTDYLLRNPSRSDTRRRFDSKVLLQPDEIEEWSHRHHALVRIRGLIQQNYWMNSSDIHSDGVFPIGQRTRIVSGYFEGITVAESAWPEVLLRLERNLQNERLLQGNPIQKIGVHVRLGDNLRKRRSQLFHGLTPFDYYERAIDHASRSSGLCDILLISDEPELASRQLTTRLAKRFNVSTAASESALSDLLVLSQCSSIVTSNSSLSWWSAFIGWKIHDAKVYVPSPWLSKEYPEESLRFSDDWTRIRRTPGTSSEWLRK